MTMVYYTELAMMDREKTRSYVNMRLFMDVENVDTSIVLIGETFSEREHVRS